MLSWVRWVRPEMVVEVSYLTWTDEGLLRQVAYLGEGEDKPAREVRRDPPVPLSPPGCRLRISHRLSCRRQGDFRFSRGDRAGGDAPEITSADLKQLALLALVPLMTKQPTRDAGWSFAVAVTELDANNGLTRTSARKERQSFKRAGH